MGRRGTPSLTRLESEVMAMIWELHPRHACVRDILDRLNRSRASRRQKQLAYNTVQTVVKLLQEKKAVRKVKSATPGRAHYFQPCFSRDEASRHILSDLSRRMFGGEIKPLIHQLIDHADLSAEELAELQQWVADKLKDANSEE